MFSGVRFSADAGLVAAASLANEPVVSTWGGTVEVHAAAKLPKSRWEATRPCADNRMGTDLGWQGGDLGWQGGRQDE